MSEPVGDEPTEPVGEPEGENETDGVCETLDDALPVAAADAVTLSDAVDAIVAAPATVTVGVAADDAELAADDVAFHTDAVGVAMCDRESVAELVVEPEGTSEADALDEVDTDAAGDAVALTVPVGFDADCDRDAV